jgi:hypothetical protein
MPLSESDTRAKLIDPAIHTRGWTEDLIRREETAGAIEIIDGRPRKRSKGRIDYTLRIKVNPDTQPVAVALIEAKAEHLPPNHGLEQGKLYAASKRLNVPFVFSANGHQYVEYDRFTGKTTSPVSIDLFPKPDELRRRYEAGMGFIFCVRDLHAEDVAIAMNNLYADWCRDNGAPRMDPYAFKCTASVGGSPFLADLRGASRSYFVATTVELLTTGVDVPRVRNIVFFKYVRSPIAFYQMVGRGTRLDAPTGKLMFRVYDYTNATRLFGEDFKTKVVPPRKPGGDGPPTPPEPTVTVHGFDVHVTDAGRFIVTTVDGKAMPVTVEEYKQRLAAKLIQEAPSLDVFRTRWVTPSDRQQMLGNMPDAGRSVMLVRDLEDMQDYDLYDVLAELGYGMARRPVRKSRYGRPRKSASLSDPRSGSSGRTGRAEVTRQTP